MNNKTNHIQQSAIELKEADRPLQYLLDKFQKGLASKPKEVQRNKHQGNSQYLPISQVQNLLDTFYLGRWQTKNFQWCEMHMQLCGTIELWLFNPITKEWQIKTGVASTQIRCDRTTGKPIKAGLMMDLPRLKADCIKNAAKGLGKIFGRDLNRKDEAEYLALLSKQVDSNIYSEQEVKEKLKTINDPADLVEYWESRQIWQQDPAIKSLFDERQKDILDEQF